MRSLRRSKSINSQKWMTCEGSFGKSTADLVGAVSTHALVVQISDLLFLPGGEGERIAGWKREGSGVGGGHHRGLISKLVRDMFDKREYLVVVMASGIRIVMS